MDGRADVFSLASVAYTLLSGPAALHGAHSPGIVHRVVYEEPEPLSRFVADLPADVERVLARALAKDPAARYATAEAFAEDAEDVLAGKPPRHAAGDDLVVVEESAPYASARRSRRGAGASSLPVLPAPAGATDTRTRCCAAARCVGRDPSPRGRGSS